MIPSNTISVLSSGGSLLPKHFAAYDTETYFRGGVSVADGSQGIDVQDWHCRISGDDIVIEPLTSGTGVTLHMTGVQAASAAFDRNMQPAVAYVVGGECYFLWFDTITQTFVTTHYPSVRNIMVVHDDVRDSSAITSDVMVTYQRGPGVFWRQQRDRYGVEYTAAAHAPGELNAFGMSNQWRLLWRCTP